MEQPAAGIWGRKNAVVEAAGVVIEHWHARTLMTHLRDRLNSRNTPPVAIASINLDHFHHFGQDRAELPVSPQEGGVDWLMLADGAPVAALAGLRAGLAWPRLTGADLLPQILRLAETHRMRMGFLGGIPEVHEQLGDTLRSEWPNLPQPSYWAPSRTVIEDRDASLALASEIAAADVDILCVALGKPRQEFVDSTLRRRNGSQIAPRLRCFSGLHRGQDQAGPELDSKDRSGVGVSLGSGTSATGATLPRAGTIRPGTHA